MSAKRFAAVACAVALVACVAASPLPLVPRGFVAVARAADLDDFNPPAADDAATVGDADGSNAANVADDAKDATPGAAQKKSDPVARVLTAPFRALARLFGGGKKRKSEGDTAKSKDAQKTDAANAERAAADQKRDERKTDAHKTDKQKTETQKTDTSKTDVRKSDARKADEARAADTHAPVSSPRAAQTKPSPPAPSVAHVPSQPSASASPSSQASAPSPAQPSRSSSAPRASSPSASQTSPQSQPRAESLPRAASPQRVESSQALPPPQSKPGPQLKPEPPLPLPASSVVRATTPNAPTVATPGAAVAGQPKQNAPFTPLVVGVAGDPLSQGRALLERGYVTEAIRELNIAAVTGTNLIEANNLLGLAHDLRGMHKEAQGYYERALSVAPDDPRVLNNLGYSLYLDDRYREALSKLKLAARLDPARPEIYNNLGFVYARLNKYDDALKNFARAGGDFYARWQVATLLEAAGRDREAIKHFEAARRIDPASSTSTTARGSATRRKPPSAPSTDPGRRRALRAAERNEEVRSRNGEGVITRLE